MIKPPPELDGAVVLWWAHAGDQPFGELPGASEDDRWIFAFAVCQYAPSTCDHRESIYRFSCNRKWDVIQDSDYESVEQAKAGIPLQYDRARVRWQRYVNNPDH